MWKSYVNYVNGMQLSQHKQLCLAIHHYSAIFTEGG